MSFSGGEQSSSLTDRTFFKYSIMIKVKTLTFSQARAPGEGIWGSESSSFFLTPEVTLCLSFLILGGEKSNKLIRVHFTIDVGDLYTLGLVRSIQFKKMPEALAFSTANLLTFLLWDLEFREYAVCDGNGEGCYRMRFSRMDGGRVRWPQKCLDVRAPLKRGIYRVAVTSSWSSGLEIDHGASSYTFHGRTWEVEWEAWESLSPWAGILLSYNRALVRSATSWTRLFLFLSSLSFFPASLFSGLQRRLSMLWDLYSAAYK